MERHNTHSKNCQNEYGIHIWVQLYSRSTVCSLVLHRSQWLSSANAIFRRDCWTRSPQIGVPKSGVSTPYRKTQMLFTFHNASKMTRYTLDSTCYSTAPPFPPPPPSLTSSFANAADSALFRYTLYSCRSMFTLEARATFQADQRGGEGETHCDQERKTFHTLNNKPKSEK